MYIKDNDEEPDEVGGRMEDSDEEPDVVEAHRGRETRWSSIGRKATRTRTTRMSVEDYRLKSV